MKCPRKRTDMTPCVVEDGPDAYGFNSATDRKPRCVGCGWGPKSTSIARPINWDQIVADYLRKEGVNG